MDRQESQRTNTLYMLLKDAPGGQNSVTFQKGIKLIDAEGKVFRLDRFAFRGGNGSVFYASELDNKGNIICTCAVKLLGALTDERRDRFKNEARLMKEFSHDHISKFYASGETDLEQLSFTLPWIAMDLGGFNLDTYVKRNGPIDFPKVVRLGNSICSALKYIHGKGIIHRDLKPANIVWVYPDTFDDVMMIDFGIAKYYNEDVASRPLDQFTTTTEIVGPALYSSPELIKYATNKAHPVTKSSDIYQLGMLLWFLATGEILAGIPSKKLDPTRGPFRDLICEMYSQDPDDRPSSIDEVLSRLNSMIN